MEVALGFVCHERGLTSLRGFKSSCGFTTEVCYHLAAAETKPLTWWLRERSHLVAETNLLFYGETSLLQLVNENMQVLKVKICNHFLFLFRLVFLLFLSLCKPNLDSLK